MFKAIALLVYISMYIIFDTLKYVAKILNVTYVGKIIM